MFLKKWHYFSVWKALDWTSYLLFFAVIGVVYSGNKETTSLVTIISILSFVLWLRFFFYLSFSFSLAQVGLLLRIMIRMAQDTFWFFIIFFVVLMAFSHAAALANANPQLNQPAGTTIYWWMLISYRALISDVIYDDYTRTDIVWTNILYIFLVGAFGIFLINLLIAMYSESYGRIRAEAQSYLKLRQADLILNESGIRKLKPNDYEWNTYHAIYVKGWTI